MIFGKKTLSINLAINAIKTCPETLFLSENCINVARATFRASNLAPISNNYFQKRLRLFETPGAKILALHLIDLRLQSCRKSWIGRQNQIILFDRRGFVLFTGIDDA